jgi:hypothetical protein
MTARRCRFENDFRKESDLAVEGAEVRLRFAPGHGASIYCTIVRGPHRGFGARVVVVKPWGAIKPVIVRLDTIKTVLTSEAMSWAQMRKISTMQSKRFP